MRWPRVLGTIGMVVAAVMFLDKANDLLMVPLMRSPDWWADMLGEKLAADIMRWMPSETWVVLSGLAGMSLGVLLFVGALRLRRGRRSGVALCRAWSWLAIVWLLVEVSWAFWWLSALAGEIPQLASGDWQGPALFGTLAVVAVMAAFPVFLLIWLARPASRAVYAGWPR